MMYNTNAYSKYKESSVYSASPEELTLMLFNGLVKFIMQAQEANIRKDVQKCHSSIIRAQDIIQEFQITLDRQYEVSKGLDSMYTYMYDRLVQANIKKDNEILNEVLGYARELRDTWEQAMKIARQSRADTEPMVANSR